MIIFKIMIFQLLPIIQILDIIFFNIFRIDNSTFYWAVQMKNWFKWNHYEIPNSFELYDKECVYFHNHRSEIDFAVDIYSTAGKSAIISRWFVFFAVPFMGILTMIDDCVFYFSRDGNINKKDFIKWIYNRLQNSNYNSLNIYPEGTRRFDNEVIRIKHGGILYSYEYKTPIQIIITKNKEKIFSLKMMTYSENVNCFTYMSNNINPNEYETFEEYRTFVCKEWERCWKLVYENEYSIQECKVLEPKYVKIHKKNINRILLSQSIFFSIMIGILLFYKIL
jgi:1-acyl-sn-glycerol-3-phosphate acyltransferase